MFSTHLQEYALDKYQGRKKYYSCLWEEIEEALKGCTEEEAILMRFLYGTMPVRDAGEYDFQVFLSYVQHALWLRRNMKWCGELTEDIFIHHVLYYRINSEDISDCRKFFYEQLKDRIQGMSLEEAVIEINYWCAENAVYESTDERTASPMTVFRCGKGRCGEESTFAVTAYRSVGIPARQVYTPRWAHCDDNHAWVEIYLHGKWYFIGACEPEEGLNRGWFTVPANRAILIHSRTFSDFMINSSEECIGKENLLTYYNNTPFYAKTRELTVTVKDQKGQPVKDAFAAVEILNMAEYFPAVTLVTDSKGEAHVSVGLGDVRVRAWKGDTFGEKKVSLKVTAKAELSLECSAGKPDWVTDEWEQAGFSAPEECPMHLGRETQEQKERKARRLKEANQIREQRFVACYDEKLASVYTEEAGMFRTAGENAAEIRAFLTKDENPGRRRMLHSLAVKDYKDLKASILEDHLGCEQGSLNEETYEKYLLCPRISKEELTPYRSFIRAYFKENEKERFGKNPEQIWKYIKDTIHYDTEVDYSTICATPIGCLKMKQGNSLAQKILFAAICRSLNIPARLNSVTLAPEYLKEGVFTIPEGFAEGQKAKDIAKEDAASLILKVKDKSKWNYFQTWTIGKLEGVHFDTLNYEGVSFEDNALELVLEPGVYRLITSMRMPNGDQHTSQRVFCLEHGEQKSIEMTLWESEAKDMLVNYSLNDFPVQDNTGKEYMVSELVTENAVILAFLGVGEEPTEHVLNELLASASHWKETAARMVMVLREPGELKNATLRRVLESLSGVELFFDEQRSCERAAAKMHVDADKLPVLILIQKELVGIYACAGYNVGSVELMLKLLEQ
ncbi:transglutaminase domain-containing protein [Anaerocolumna xylanovorans]|uniref:Transglutaminase-like superfamily protein n=1 Tax=Anaerocolumna xylanovorans DSM 12503 TaxID=1121345 RepID=A0A1M7Y9D0_9FIRM|nr:transglutaminase domain-containing protein [Anaerocolumna xylanovorans]SHO49243.1 Transglutaminase-like superfamily protein [Anaerocolumna xylanovorans DSM 12503]